MLNFQTLAPGSYADSNLVVDSAIGLDPSLEGVEAETGQHRYPSHLARGHEVASRFSRFAAPVRKLAARTVAVAGTTAALSPMAAADPVAFMKADPVALSFGFDGLAVMGALGVVAGMGIQGWLSAMKFTSAAKGRALDRFLPSLYNVNIPAEAKPIALPAGEFRMGKTYYNRVAPVVLSAFYMMERDVSNGFFRQFRPSHHSSDGFDGDNQPVVDVSYGDAADFANWMNETCPVHDMEWRLPTEAEMEYAILGKGQRASKFVRTRRVNIRDDYTLDTDDETLTLDVDSEAHRNSYGLIHIRGNVKKWCLDYFGDYSDEPLINPRGPIKPRHQRDETLVGLARRGLSNPLENMMIKGGFLVHTEDFRGERNYFPETIRDMYTSFRLVLAFKDEWTRHGNCLFRDKPADWGNGMGM